MSVRVSPRVAVMGAGAVGCYFGGMLARGGAEVTLVARPQHVEAIARDGLRLETLQFDERVRIAASTDMKVAGDAEIVLITVKTPDTESAAQALAPHLRSDALIVSVQNGVDNAQRLRAERIRCPPGRRAGCADSREPDGSRTSETAGSRRV